MFAVGVKLGQAAPALPDETLTVPVDANHSVTEPPPPTERKSPFTIPVPSPTVPLTDVGGAGVPDWAKPLTSIKLVRCDGSSSPVRFHVENEPPLVCVTTRCTPTKYSGADVR